MNKKINFLIYLISFANLLIVLSCSSKKDKIIPRDEFIDLLTELHCTDAIITQKGLTGFNLKDSIPFYYNYILKKYHTTKDAFDLTMEYYSNDVHEMLAIYDEVISKINNKIPKKLSDKSIYKIFDIALEEATIKSDPDKWFGTNGIELWNKMKSTNITNEDTVNRMDFTTKLKYQSLILLKASILLYPNDSSKNLRMVLKINYIDTTSDYKEKPIADKNGRWTDYQVFLKTDSTKKTESVESFVLEFDSITGKRHVAVKNISLKQFGPNKDTSELVIKEEAVKKADPVIKKPILNKKINPLRKSRPSKID
jgi:hypothetical protein